MTKTARQSKWLFWVNIVIGVSSLAIFIAEDSGVMRWLRLIMGLVWSALAVAYYRSWRLLGRTES